MAPRLAQRIFTQARSQANQERLGLPAWAGRAYSDDTEPSRAISRRPAIQPASMAVGHTSGSDRHLVAYLVDGPVAEIPNLG